jgi:NAD(P)-dependent dehydrogenase (short-subunit alcohol dehydrogenase family)
MKQLKNVLITGADGGFGTGKIDALLTAGYTVTGAMRDTSGRNQQAAATLEKKGVFVVEIDVTSDESIVAGVHKAAAQIGQYRHPYQQRRIRRRRNPGRLYG